MAQVKYGSIITEIKGKIGGTTFQGGRSGGLAKNKGNLRKTRHDTIKGTAQLRLKAMADVVKRWGKLSPEQRNSWNALVGTWTFKNKFGDTYDGTGYQIYTAANINRKTLGLSPLDDAPIMNAAYDPNASFSDYSISGVFEGTYTNALADGQYEFAQVTWAGNETTPPEKLRIAGSIPFQLPGAGTQSFKSVIQSIYGGNPPVNSFFYIKVWFCWADYPQAQFKQIFKIKVKP